MNTWSTWSDSEVTVMERAAANSKTSDELAGHLIQLFPRKPTAELRMRAWHFFKNHALPWSIEEDSLISESLKQPGTQRTKADNLARLISRHSSGAIQTRMCEFKNKEKPKPVININTTKENLKSVTTPVTTPENLSPHSPGASKAMAPYMRSIWLGNTPYWGISKVRRHVLNTCPKEATIVWRENSGKVPVARMFAAWLFEHNVKHHKDPADGNYYWNPASAVTAVRDAAAPKKKAEKIEATPTALPTPTPSKEPRLLDRLLAIGFTKDEIFDRMVAAVK